MTGKRSGQNDRLRIEIEAPKTDHVVRSAPHGCNDGTTDSDHEEILPFQYAATFQRACEVEGRRTVRFEFPNLSTGCFVSQTLRRQACPFSILSEILTPV